MGTGVRTRVRRMALTAPLSLLVAGAAGAAVYLMNPGAELLPDTGTAACEMVNLLGAAAAGFAGFAWASWLMGWFGPVQRGQAVTVSLMGFAMGVGYLWLWGWPAIGHG